MREVECLDILMAELKACLSLKIINIVEVCSLVADCRQFLTVLILENELIVATYERLVVHELDTFDINVRICLIVVCKLDHIIRSENR